MLKKLLALLVTVTIFGSMGTTVFASEAISIEPRAAVCPHCSTGQLLSKSVHTSWQRTGYQRLCPDMPFGYDFQESRETMISLDCTNCSYGTSYSAGTETRWICNGEW